MSDDYFRDLVPQGAAAKAVIDEMEAANRRAEAVFGPVAGPSVEAVAKMLGVDSVSQQMALLPNTASDFFGSSLIAKSLAQDLPGGALLSESALKTIEDAAKSNFDLPQAVGAFAREFEQAQQDARDRDKRELEKSARRVSDQMHDLNQTVRASSERFVQRIADEVESRRKVTSASPDDERILQTLRELPLNSAADLYEQGIRELEEAHRVAWLGTAANFRQAQWKTLEHLAPDADVLTEPGFKQDPDRKGPTMKQRIAFVLRGLGAGSDTIKTAVDAAAVIDAIGDFGRSAYVNSSGSVHSETTRANVERIRDFTRIVLVEILGLRQP